MIIVYLHLTITNNLMKKGQNVIVLTFKESGETYVFGSLAAIYAMNGIEDKLGIKYTTLRNAVSAYIKENNVNEDESILQVIYDTKKSSFTLYRAPLLLADKTTK